MNHIDNIQSMTLTGTVKFIQPSQLQQLTVQCPKPMNHLAHAIPTMLYERINTALELHIQLTSHVKPHVLHVHHTMLLSIPSVFRTICEALDADR